MLKQAVVVTVCTRPRAAPLILGRYEDFHPGEAAAAASGPAGGIRGRSLKTASSHQRVWQCLGGLALWVERNQRPKTPSQTPERTPVGSVRTSSVLDSFAFYPLTDLFFKFVNH